LIGEHDRNLQPKFKPATKLRSVSRVIPVDWTDYNGHMNEGRYGQVFSDAADSFMISIGADAAYIAAGHSYFTAETTVKYLQEAHAGQHIYVESEVLLAEGKKLKLRHFMRADDGTTLASCEQFMLHVSLSTRKSCAPLPEVADRLNALKLALEEQSL